MGGAAVTGARTEIRVGEVSRARFRFVYPRRARTGQASVELVLVLPILFMVLFAIVELALFFGATSYVNYAAWVGARAQQVGEDAEGAAKMLLDGNITRDTRVRSERSRGTVSVRQRWRKDMPFQLGTGDLDFEVTVTAGPDEERYEGRTLGNPSRYADNQCRGRC
jgi:Flp pilus assembly protein TadG